jgi:hypothetical protein
MDFVNSQGIVVQADFRVFADALFKGCKGLFVAVAK